MRDGVIADFADTGDTLFLNARRPPIGICPVTVVCIRVSPPFSKPARAPSGSATGGTCRIGWPETTLVSSIFAPAELPSSSRTTRFRRPLRNGRRARPSTTARRLSPLPGGLADGDYDWLIGLFEAAGDGHRVPLQGTDDGTLRVRLGALHLAKAGAVVTFTAETNRPAFDPATWYAPAPEQLEQRGGFWRRANGRQHPAPSGRQRLGSQDLAA